MALATLCVVLLLGEYVFISANASAQDDQQVILIVGEKSRDACEVQYRRSDDGSWGEQSIEGPPVACEGGLVTAYVTTRSEAVAKEGEAEARTRSSRSDTGWLLVRTVELTGNESADEAQVDAKITEIQNIFDPEVEELALTSNYALGYMGPEILNDILLMRPAPSASLLAAKCKNGQPVGTRRRADFRMDAGGVNTRVDGFVYWRRISCSRWKITDVELIPRREPTNNLWFRDLFYTQAWLGNGYGLRQAGSQCFEMHGDSWTTYRPAWEIRARGRLEVELVDANPITPGVIPSCRGGAGTSYKITKNQIGIRLAGGTK